ncbi:unnamed protein product [Sphagnum troendelagicum]|uniref:SMODS and SLOG-associating 2TM effector domain-containing protein n=1 Tax=Sphagnum troendelagicum TaxID=128251 RepID=A0ABP0UDC3_9BRYO
MAADSSTLADEYIASPHRDSTGTEHRLNIELAGQPLSSRRPVETEEPAPAVRTHGEESTPAIADNVDATVPVTPGPTPMSTVAAPTPIPTVAAPTQMSESENRLRNLVAFRGLLNTEENLCNVALEYWQSSAELMEKRVEKKEKAIRSTRNEIYQVVGFYSAFQGLLLTAIAQSNLLHWNNRGYPLALSAFATGITVTGVVQKNMIISALKKTIASENPARKALIHRVDRLLLEGIRFLFQDVYEDECKKIYKQTKLNRLYSFLFNYETLVVSTLITFGALCVASMLQILRHPDIPAQQ